MSLIATVLEHKHNHINFQVDDVEAAHDLRPVKNARLQFQQARNTRILAFSHDDQFQIIQGREIHPLVLAVHVAFSEHRPLQLTPDIVWMTIAQGFAQHINNNAESLRDEFVRHQQKKELIVSRLSIPTSAKHWVEVIQS